MSFLDSGNSRFTWIAAPARTSLRPEAGCAQCGRLLDTDSKLNLSGKSLDCVSSISDGEEEFDELED